jgi:hypothetical protein
MLAAIGATKRTPKSFNVPGSGVKRKWSTLQAALVESQRLSGKAFPSRFEEFA